MRAVSPTPHGPDIDVNEARIWVMADAAAAEIERGLPQRWQRRVCKRYVDRHALHVQAAARNAGTGVSERGVRSRRAVARDYLKRVARFERRRQIVQQIKQARVDGVHISGTVVAQDMIDRRERVRRIGAALPILGRERFTRVQIVEAQCAPAHRLPKGGARRQRRTDQSRASGKE